ncbi:zonadhesin-like isoform X2 [Haliotis rufescens]|uniref:zonadhesin-like isoform X2 n=1 Tax=Haliotis rufescens TaxID=6454 RepID=UPI00201F42D7|nr:zonadhesin-like isoform X2 [Haliotis rufescens]
MAVYKQNVLVTMSILACVPTFVTSFLMPSTSVSVENETMFQEISTKIQTTRNTSPISSKHPGTNHAKRETTPTSVRYINMTNVQPPSSSPLPQTYTDTDGLHSTEETTGSLETSDTENPSVHTETPSLQTENPSLHTENPSLHTEDSQSHSEGLQNQTEDPHLSTEQPEVTSRTHPGLDKMTIKYIALGASWASIAVVFVIISIVVRRQRTTKRRRMVLYHDDSETLAADSAMTNAETFVVPTAYRSTDNDSVIQNRAFSEYEHDVNDS